MQARLEFRRYPGTLFAAALGVLMALLLGLALGYALKPPVVTTQPGKVVFVAAQSYNPADNLCVFANHHKEC